VILRNSKPISKRLSMMLLLGLLTACSDGVPERWYSQEQAKVGQVVFQVNCASCHGKQGEGVPNWRQPDAEGRYPAPPLNGSAHAWHHSLAALQRQVSEGGIRLGGSMPSFAQQLSQAEQLAAIAAFQSFWSDDIYTKWKQIDENSL